MTIRPAQLEDLYELTELEWAYAEESGVEFNAPKSEAFRYLAGEMRKPNCAVLVWEDAGQLKGFSLVYLAKLRWYGNLTLNLDHTYILPEFRSLATHNQHLKAVVDYGKALGAVELSTLWAPQSEAERVEKAMLHSGWRKNGAYFVQGI